MSTAPNIVFHPGVCSNFSTAAFQCTKTPLPSSFVAQRKKKKRKTAIHTRLHTCCERIAWKNGGKGRAEVRKVFDIPFNPVGPINRDSADTCHVPPGYPPRQGTNHGVETRFVTRWLGWIVAFENFIRQRWPIVPRALPKLSFM